eukprot:CAMPEP_0182815696 /NCGR_PEP_ID=MMETSP0006_2-20121128/10528_1 /TAXON_ID=97485 /ORGANISM="Prymnesium parvum, Strain Texoma1" /LENGTH=99 /DNA_ID=CAMNT_0024941911 /DNA_START=146 /DNA_END=446 /DNA_ORIENTATION=+
MDWHGQKSSSKPDNGTFTRLGRALIGGQVAVLDVGDAGRHIGKVSGGLCGDISRLELIEDLILSHAHDVQVQLRLVGAQRLDGIAHLQAGAEPEHHGHD